MVIRETGSFSEIGPSSEQQFNQFVREVLHLADGRFRPEATAFGPENIKLTKLGEMQIATVNWGKRVSLEKLAKIDPEQLSKNNHDLYQRIAGFGFDGLWIYPVDVDPACQEVQELHTKITVEMVRSLAAQRRWTEIDYLHLGSYSTQPWVIEQAVKILSEQYGITVRNFYITNFACNAISDAWLGSLKGGFPGLANPLGKKVITLGMESLAMGEKCGSDSQDMRFLFGNGACGQAFVPGVDWQLIDQQAHTLVVPDTVGAITAHSIANDDLGANIPWTKNLASHYHFSDGQNLFPHENGCYMDMVASEDGFTHLNSKELLYQFVEPVVSQVMTALERHNHQLAEQYGPIDAVLAHQASYQVIRAINRLLLKAQLARLDLDSQEIRRLSKLEPADLNQELDQLQLFPRPIQLSWDMDGTNTNNVSAATIGFALQQAVERGRIKPGDTVLVVGFGVGASYTTFVVKIPESEASNQTEALTIPSTQAPNK